MDSFEESIWQAIERPVRKEGDTMLTFYWGRIAALVVETDPVRAARAAIAALKQEDFVSERDERIGTLLEAARRQPREVWELVAAAMRADWKGELLFRNALQGRLVDAIPFDDLREWVQLEGEDGAAFVAGMSSVGQNLTEVQRFLLNEFPASKDVRSAILSEMHSGAFSGPISAWSQERLNWVRGWAKDASPVIRKWALSLIPDMERSIAKAKKREAEEDFE